MDTYTAWDLLQATDTWWLNLDQKKLDRFTSDTAHRHIFLQANCKVSAVYIGENRIFNYQFDFKSV